MPSRFIKQFIYGILFLVVLGGIISGIYSAFLKPAQSCFDNIQNQGEEGVDCGGPCKKSCLPQRLQPIELVQGVKIFYPASGRISLLAKIQNPNTEIAAKDFDYQFKVYDNQNKLLGAISGRSFIYSGEIKYLAEFLEEGNFKNANRAELLIENPNWVPATEFPRPLLSVLNQQVEVYNGELRLRGKIINNDTIPFPKTIILAIFSNQLGAVVGVSRTEIENFLAGENRSFTIMHPQIPGIESPKAEILIFSRRP